MKTRKPKISFFIAFAVIITAFAVTSILTAFSQNIIGIDEALDNSVNEKKTVISDILNSKKDEINEYIQKYADTDDNGKKYDNTYDYAYFIIKYNINGNDLKYINSLLENGAPLPCVTSVYKFWLTTGEDISIMADIIDCSDDFWGNNWIENAFNYLTNNKYGVIENKEELDEYIRKGLTTEDIYNANILSRKGKKTIQEILKMRIDSKSWSYINKKINGGILDIFEAFTDSNGYFELEDNGILNLADDIKSADLSESSESATAVKIKEARESLEENIDNKVCKYILSLGIEPANEQENEEDKYEKLLEYAGEMNVFGGYVYQLENKGYDYDEIVSVIDIMSRENTDIADAVSIYKRNKNGGIE